MLYTMKTAERQTRAAATKIDAMSLWSRAVAPANAATSRPAARVNQCARIVADGGDDMRDVRRARVLRVVGTTARRGEAYAGRA